MTNKKHFKLVRSFKDDQFPDGWREDDIEALGDFLANLDATIAHSPSSEYPWMLLQRVQTDEDDP